jgi:hypothetical protein
MKLSQKRARQLAYGSLETNMKINNQPKFRINFIIILTLIIIFSLIFWAGFIFIGPFFAARIWFPIIIILMSVIGYLIIKRLTEPVFGIIFLVITLCIGLVAFKIGFEEDYCVTKGILADPYNKVIDVKPEYQKILQKYGMNKASKVGLNFITHMRCHENFNFLSAVKDNYLRIK